MKMKSLLLKKINDVKWPTIVELAFSLIRVFTVEVSIHNGALRINSLVNLDQQTMAQFVLILTS